MGPAAVGRLLVIGTAVGWGFGWPMMRLAMQDWPPLFARGTAGLLAALGLALAATLRAEPLLPPRACLGRLAVRALINVFAWMGFSGLALQWLPVAEAALLTFTMPIWATLLAWPLRGRRPGTASVAALCLGIAGLLLLLGGDVGGELGAGRWPGIALSLAAALLFALGAVTFDRPLPLPPLVLTAWLVGLGSLAMLLAGWALEAPDIGALTATGAGAIAYLAAVPMALCYLAWFGALRRIPAATAATGVLLVPVIGALSAALLVGEPLELRHAAAFALTLGGVALALRRPAAATG